MFLDEVLTFAPTSLVATTAGSAVALFAGVGMSLLAVPAVAKRVLPAAKETRLADFLPFQAIDADGQTVTFKDGSAGRILSISGFDQSFLPDGQAREIFAKRKMMIDALADHSVQLRIFTFRERVDHVDDGDHATPLATDIAKRWNRNFLHAYVTRTVLFVTCKHPGKDFVSLDEAINVILQTLQQYGPRVLTQKPSGDVTLTLGAVLGRLVSPVSRPRPNAYGDGLSEALCADELEFKRNGRIQIRSGDDVKFCSVIGIRKFGDNTSTAMAAELAAISGEIMVLQTVEPQNKAKAIITLKQNQKMMSTTSFSFDTYQQYADAIALVDGMDENKAAICGFSETIFVFGDDEAEVKELEKTVRQIMTNYGVTSVIESGATQCSWFMQFPTYDLKPRVYRLMSTNVAQLATFDRAPSGLPRSSWGEGPIARFYTGANSVYSHQFHIDERPQSVGHGVVIAPTGAGKTTLMQMLSLMASRHKNLKHFFFDRHNGTYIYTTAMGGQYMSFNGEEHQLSVRGGMNPFQCAPSQSNIDFLKVWLRAITRTNSQDEREESRSLDQIANAVSLAFNAFGDDERSLASIYDGGFEPNGRLQLALKKWVDPEQYGQLFNAERDSISLDSNWLTSFDMTRLLEDELLGAAAVSYIMHRIKETLIRTRSSGFIFIDETEPLLRNPDFKKQFFVMLQEFRKLDAVVISVFQRPEALRGMNVSEVVLQQAAAYYLFQNPGATEAHYADFGLTPQEMGFVLGKTRPARFMTRGLLVKRPLTQESVIIDIDFSSLGPYLKVFSSSSKDVALVNDLQRQFGAKWVERYIHPEAP